MLYETAASLTADTKDRALLQHQMQHANTEGFSACIEHTPKQRRATSIKLEEEEVYCSCSPRSEFCIFFFSRFR